MKTVRTTRNSTRVLYSQDPEWYGYEWSEKYGDYIYRSDDGIYKWSDLGYDETSTQFDCVMDGFPIENNKYVVEGDGWRDYAAFDYLPPAVEYASGNRDIHITDENGDLVVNGIRIRVLTDKGQRWFDNNTYFESSNSEEIAHCFETNGYTKKLVPSAKKLNRKPFDRSKYYDAEKHPLRNFPGNLYTIDRGFGNGDGRYVTARGNMGTDGLPGQLASVYKGRKMSWDQGYEDGERLHGEMKVGERKSLRNGISVTRVKNTKPRKKGGR